MIDLNKRCGTSNGRPSRILEENVRAKVIEYIGQGNYIGTACQAAGIAPNTLSSWLEKGKQAEQYIYNIGLSIEDALELGDKELPAELQDKMVYLRFLHDVKRAEAMAEAEHVNHLMVAGKAGPQFWAASATYLERKFPDRWAKRESMSIDFQQGLDTLTKLTTLLQSDDVKLLAAGNK